MIWLLSCTSVEQPSQILSQFSPAIVDVVHSVSFVRSSDCRSLTGVWHTSLPQGTQVQSASGKKIDNTHFDDYIEQSQALVADEKGRVPFSPRASDKPYLAGTIFLNLRVWATTKELEALLLQSEQKGGFALAESPGWKYAWAESEIQFSPCP